MVTEDASSDDGQRAEEPSVRAVRAIAAYSNQEPHRLPPLAQSVDPDALDRLVGSLVEGSVSFVHAGHQIRLAADGDVSVPTLDPDATSERE